MTELWCDWRWEDVCVFRAGPPSLFFDADPFDVGPLRRFALFLRGGYFWRHDRRWEQPLANVICWVVGHTDNVRDGGDCRRCWGP